MTQSTAEISENAYGTWLEPYIGMDLPIKKRGKKVSSIDFWGDGSYVNKIENIYLIFSDEEPEEKLSVKDHYTLIKERMGSNG
jgi:hypothetical protein